MRLFRRAIELDPGFASAYGMAAWCYVQRKGNRWATDGMREVVEALPLARKAVDLGCDDAVALATGGYALAFVGGEQDIGSAYIERALTLNPNLPTAWFADAWLRIWRGEPEIALRHFTHLTRLSPFEPITAFIKSSIMFAHCMIGQHGKACASAEQVLREAPDLHCTWHRDSAPPVLPSPAVGTRRAEPLTACVGAIRSYACLTLRR